MRYNDRAHISDWHETDVLGTLVDVCSVKRTSHKPARMSAFDPDCVKTQKIEARRERFFFDRSKLIALANIHPPSVRLGECLFCRR